MWETFGEAGGITFEHLANAADLRLFRWTPCPEVQNCEVAEFLNPGLHGDKPNVQPTSIVNDDGTTVRAAIGLYPGDGGIAVAVDDDGGVIEGFRCKDPAGACNLMMPGLWGHRFFANILEKNLDKERVLHVVFGDFEALPGFATTVDVSSIPAGTPGPPRLGEQRLVMRWAPVARLSSVSALDGSDHRLFAAVETEGGVFEINVPDTTGSHFIFDEDIDLGGGIETRIRISDGISGAVPYIVPAPGEYVGSPRFAHSHVGWLRASGMQSINTFEKVELWASPFHTDPTKLQAFKVGDVPITWVASGGVGGHGRYAILKDNHAVDIWTLATKTFVDRRFPSFMKSRGYLGVTRTHLWMTGTDPNGTNRGDWLVRFTVQ